MIHLCDILTCGFFFLCVCVCVCVCLSLSPVLQPSRLYVKGAFLGFKRGRRNTYHHTSLVKIDGVQDAKAAEFYFGKKIAYIYKATKAVNGSKFRAVWGKVLRAHGSNGVVRAKFATNLNVSASL